MNMKKIIGMILVLSLLSSAYFNVNVKAATEPLIRAMSDYMYTSITVTLYEGSESDLDEVEKIFQEYTIISNNFNYKDDDFDGENDYLSNPFYGTTGIYDLNLNASTAPVQVGQKLFDLLMFSKQLYEDTNGYFDPSIGKAVDLVKTGITNHGFEEMPKAEFDTLMTDLHNLVGKVSFDDVVLDETNLTVFYKNDLVKLDLGAVAKGYATQKAQDYLASKNITKFMINAGSSNIAAGVHPDNRDWRLGLKDPVNPIANLYGIVSITNKALVTSGNFEQFFTYNDKRYHHIISPKDYLPKQYYHSISLIGDDSGYLDGLSTALFNMPYDMALEILENLDVEAIIYMYDGSVKTVLNDTDFELRQVTDPKTEKESYQEIAYILGGVIIVGGIIIVILSINEKKKGAKNEGQKEE